MNNNINQKILQKKETIKRKWEKKYKEIEWGEDIRLADKKKKLRSLKEQEYERAILREEKRHDAYLKRKKLEYERKCKNEIRKLEWKEVKIYKKKKKFNLIEFCMELQQENSKLRDTDVDWNGFCISCDKLCTWSELAGWHRHSRSIRNICLLPQNINAQCHTCNRTTWPRWNTIAKEKTNREYDINLDIKYWKWTAEQLRQLKEAYFQNPNGTNWDLDNKYVEWLIKENEERWSSKSFYKPKKNWRKAWEENRP